MSWVENIKEIFTPTGFFSSLSIIQGRKRKYGDKEPVRIEKHHFQCLVPSVVNLDGSH